MFEKKELRYILAAFGIAFVWMVFTIPNIDKWGIGPDPFVRFLIFNVGIFFLLQVALKSSILNSRIRFSETLGLLMVANGIDLLAPPFIFNTLGQANTGALLSTASTDYVVGMLWQSLGTSGFILYLMVYVVTPVLLFMGAGLLLKNFVRNV